MTACVVCAAAAKVYCDADKAFLCTDCDKKVHSSNVLAARHVRKPVCELCKASVCTVYCCNDTAYVSPLYSAPYSLQDWPIPRCARYLCNPSGA